MKDIRLNETDLETIEMILDRMAKAGPEGERLAKEKADGSYAYAFGYTSAVTRDYVEILRDFLKGKGGQK
jgi:hypothetical protein